MKTPAFDRITTAFERNVLHLNEAREQGRRVVGQFCLYTPSEIALAAGAIPVSLCGTRSDSIPAAETMLPRGLCPLIKSSFGFAINDSCPYLSAADLVVADTTCDGKKKMYELLAAYKPLVLLQLPQEQSPRALAWWREELAGLVRRYEEAFQVRVDNEALRAAIRLMNRQRRALKALMDLAKRRPSPLSGLELVEIGFKTDFFPDKEVAVRMLEDLVAETAVLTPEGDPSAPRILLTGVPVGIGSHKVVRLIEECGGAVVCLDNCSAYKKTRIMPAEEGDPLDALAAAYLNVPCAVMSPNPHRYTALRELCEVFAVDAVIDLTWNGCQTYATEAFSIRRFVRESLDRPCLNLETDYSETDTEQLKVRIEAFLEMLTPGNFSR